MTRNQFINKVNKLGNVRVTDYFTTNMFADNENADNLTNYFAICIDYDADGDKFYAIAYQFHTMNEPKLSIRYDFKGVRKELVNMMAI